MKGTYEIRKLPVWPVAKVAFVVLLVVGIIVAVIYSLILSGLSFLAGVFGDSPIGEEFSAVRNLGFVIIPVIALTYAVFGTIAAVIWALIYNIVASIVGGFEVHLRPKEAGVATPVGDGPGAGTEIHVPDRPIEGF